MKEGDVTMPNGKKAVVFIGQAYPAGVYFNLARLGIAMYCACPSDLDFYYMASKEEANKGAWELVKQRIPRNAILEGGNLSGLIRDAERLFGEYDQVLFHTGGGFGQIKLLLPLKRKFGRRIKVTVITHSYRHCSWLRAPMSLCQALMYARYADKVIFQCPNAKNRFVGAELLDIMGKTAIIPLGCEAFDDVSEEVPQAIKSLGLEGMLLDSSLFKFVYLAQLHQGKRHEWLIKSLCPVFRLHKEARLILCGEGPLRDKLSSLIAQLGMSGQMLLTGQIQRSGIPWILGKSDCSVVPTRAETFGHAFVEPMMAGVPVIGTRVGAGEYLIQDYRTGIGITLKSSETLRNAVEYVIQNREKCKEMGENAREMTAQLFTYKSIGQAHMCLCSDLLRV